jgi:RNA polymerase sigma factor (TIGR02999 family)
VILTVLPSARQHDAANGSVASEAASAAAALRTDELFTAVYARLKAMASRQLSMNGTPTLDTTALVHELYVKVAVGRELIFDHPFQFFRYAAQAMRHIVVDRARGRLCAKRGAGARQTDSHELQVVEQTAVNVVDLDQALRQLEMADARAAELVELHYFAGLSLPQIAELLGVTVRTLSRDWRFARAFLLQQLGG